MITFDMLLEKREEIIALAAKHKAEHVRVFGSVARGDADEHSDLDLLVHFQPGASLFDLMDLQEASESLLHVPVDVVSDRGLSPYLKDSILRDAVDL
jgi:predicted nucleotidyltransferase